MFVDNWFWPWFSAFFTVIGIIVMLILYIKSQSFVVDKLIEFGNVLEKLKHSTNGEIRRFGDSIVCYENDKPTSLLTSVSVTTQFKHKIL